MMASTSGKILLPALPPHYLDDADEPSPLAYSAMRRLKKTSE
jgi:hypothetical protein